jgi:ABC-2 type transport system permease protein
MTAPSSASADASSAELPTQDPGQDSVPNPGIGSLENVRGGAAQLAHRPSLLARGKGVWDSRRILRILVIRDLKMRYSGTVLGSAWTLLDPILLAFTYWFVFGVIVSRGAANEQPYLLWVLTGILPFQWTTHVLGDSGRLLAGDAKLVTASNLPRELWTLRVVLSRFIEFLFTLPITAVAMFLFANLTDMGQCTTSGCLSKVGPSWWLLAIPLAFVVQFIFNLGLALTLSPLCMLYPDVHRVVRVFSTLFRYMSPVIYGLATLEVIIRQRGWPSWILTLYELNPMVGILNTYHAVMFPDNTDRVFLLLGLSAFLSCSLFWCGLIVFRRLEPRVLKEL